MLLCHSPFSLFMLPMDIPCSTSNNIFIQPLFQFKEECNTEKKIASKLKSLSEKSLAENEDKIRRDLFDLLRVKIISDTSSHLNLITTNVF